MRAPDAVVVGSGPNGLAAALTLARAGLAVDVFEGGPTAGGGCRTGEITLPGFRHDICSTVQGLAVASPFFAGTDLAGRGVELLYPRVAFAHPLPGGRAGAVTGSVEETAAGLGADAARYIRLMAPLVRDAGTIVPGFLAPLRSVPPRPVPMARFGALGLLPADGLARGFKTEEARGLLAGVAAHSMLPLRTPLTRRFTLWRV
jgi:phytoene dehydrogenase-like protein